MVEVAGRLGEADLNVDDIANMSLLYQCLYFEEVRQIATVISNEAGNPGFIGDTVDAAALFVGNGHRLLYVDRFTCLHGHDGVRSM